MDFLVDLIIIWGIIVLYRRWTAAGRARFRPAPPGPAPTPRVRSGGEMAACAHCGLFLPRTDTVTGTDGQTYCSREHARAHR